MRRSKVKKSDYRSHYLSATNIMPPTKKYIKQSKIIRKDNNDFLATSSKYEGEMQKVQKKKKKKEKKKKVGENNGQLRFRTQARLDQKTCEGPSLK